MIFGIDVFGPVEDKPWGKTQCLFRSSSFILNRAEISATGYSSLHCHNFMYNSIFVESGEIEITKKQNENAESSETILLRAGSSLIIPPDVYHMFSANEDTVMYEMYYMPICPNDIVRSNLGGKTGSQILQRQNPHT